MRLPVEVVNLSFLCEWRSPEWRVLVESGDLRQGKSTYPKMARRVTLEDLSTQLTKAEVFMGSGCGGKAVKWLTESTNGASDSYDWTLAL